MRTAKDLPANQRAAESCGTTLAAIHEYMEKRDILKMLAAIRASGERAAKIVENMLSFSRKGGSAFLPHALDELLDNTLAHGFERLRSEKEVRFSPDRNQKGITSRICRRCFAKGRKFSRSF